MVRVGSTSQKYKLSSNRRHWPSSVQRFRCPSWDGAALRGTFIIDPEGIIRHMSINELDVGRNVNETLRVLQALRTGELCPVDWKPGQSTLTTYDEWLAKALPRLPKQVLVDATKKLQTTKYSPGQMVFEQGDAPDRFYIVSAGEVEVIRRKRDGSEKIFSGPSSGQLLLGRLGSSLKHVATLRFAPRLMWNCLQ